MALAYSTFANGGYKVEPVSILKVEDKYGNILEEYEAPAKRELILDPQVAYLINNVLSDPEARPDEYWRNLLTIPGHVNGAKTGTSNKKKNDINYPFDTWTSGYVRNLVTTVWTGNADGEHLSLKASGLDCAGYIWKNYMVEAVKKVEKADFEKPEGIKWVKVSKRSGKLPSEYTPEEDIVSAVFANFSTPTEYDDAYRFVEIDKVSGLLATEYTPKEAIEEKAFYTHHSILRDNEQWESAVRKWAKDNGEDEEPPTEYDNIHTPDNMDVKPQITIESPASRSTISPPMLGVWVDISSAGGVSKVDYFFDDELADTATVSPFNGRIPVSNSLRKGSSHTIKAIVYDELYRSSQSSVTVKIGTDDTPPKVSFTYPENGDRLTAGTSISAKVTTSDPNGAVERVRFYLDGQLKKEDTEPPFSYQMTVPLTPGDYELQAVAYDYADNKAEDNIRVVVLADEGNLAGDSRVLLPRDNASFDEGEEVLLKAFVSEADRNDLSDIVFLAKKDDQLPIEVSKVSTADEAGAMTYSVIWDSPPAGTYQLYIKIVLKDGKLRFSKKVPIVVR